MKQPDPELKELMSSKIIEAIMRLYWDDNYPIGSDFMYIRNQNNGDVFTTTVLWSEGQEIMKTFSIIGDIGKRQN